MLGIITKQRGAHYQLIKFLFKIQSFTITRVLVLSGTGISSIGPVAAHQAARLPHIKLALKNKSTVSAKHAFTIRACFQKKKKSSFDFGAFSIKFAFSILAPKCASLQFLYFPFHLESESVHVGLEFIYKELHSGVLILSNHTEP